MGIIWFLIYDELFMYINLMIFCYGLIVVYKFIIKFYVLEVGIVYVVFVRYLICVNI